MNADTKSKIADLEKAKVRADTIVAEHKSRGIGLSGEALVTVDALMTKMRDLRADIDRETQMESKLADLADMDKYLNDPVRLVPHGINPDNDSRRDLLKAGWDIKGGMICAPTSMEGKTVQTVTGSLQTVGKVPMFPEEVLFGDIPTDDDDAARYFKKTRAIFAPIYSQAYNRFLRLCVKTRNEGIAFTMLTNAEQKALSEGGDTAGGYLVPPDVQAEVLVRVAQQAVMRQYARVQPTSRDVLRWPAVAPNTTSGFTNIYSSGFVGGWVGETPAFSDTDPAFQLFDIPIRKLRVATKLANDFVADAAVNITAFLAQNGSENMALVEDYGFFQGTGGPLQPLGILNSGITTGDVEGSTSNTISNTSSSTGSAPKIGTNVFYKLPSQYASRAKWVMRRTIEGKVRALVDGQNRPLWPAYMDSGFAAAPTSLFGAPVVTTDMMPDDGTDTNAVLLVGDLSQYIIAQRAQITSVVLRERFADTDQTGIILFERVGGAVWNTSAFYIGVV